LRGDAISQAQQRSTSAMAVAAMMKMLRHRGRGCPILSLVGAGRGSEEEQIQAT